MKQSLQVKSFQNNYEQNTNCITKRILFTPLIRNLFDIKEKINSGKDLEKQDVLNIMERDDSQTLSKIFIRNIDQIKKQEKTAQISSKIIFYALFRTFKDHIFFIFLIYLLDVFNRVALSIILQLLFQNVNDGNFKLSYIYASIFALCLFIQGILRHNQFYQGPILGGRLRSCLILTLLQKISHLSQFVANKAQIGKITNMLSNDFNTIQIKAPFFFILTSIPFIYVSVTIVLIVRLGWQGSICIILPLIFLPIQTWIGKTNGNILVEINVNKDKRVKLAGELVQGIKHIKIYGWELIFMNMIKSIRQSQAASYIKLVIGRSFENALSQSTAFVGCFLAFLIISYTDDNLTSAKIFSTLQLIAFLKAANSMGNLGIGFMYELQILFDRFANILNLQDIRMIKIKDQSSFNIKKNMEDQPQFLHFQNKKISEANLINLSDSQYQIILKPIHLEKQDSITQVNVGEIQFVNFCAFWKETYDNPTLKNINLKLQSKKFYGLTGKVGCGKSALLGSLIHQLPYYSGDLMIGGKIAYVQQQPILFSLTLKDNILFGRQYNQQRYREVVKVSSLTSDFKLFPQRDQTLIGQKGVTLSGGQKARLALARALYQNADIYLFDDPLSAVDTKVAKNIYDNVICSFLKDKTILLSTHQTHFLDKCQKIIVLEEGKVIGFDKIENVKMHLEDVMKQEKKQQIQHEQTQNNQEQKYLKKDSMSLSKTLVGSSTLNIPSSIKHQEHSQILDDSTAPQTLKQKNIIVDYHAYVDYMFYWSKFIFILIVILFICDQLLYAFFFRFLAYNDTVKEGINSTFKSKSIYWLSLGLLCLGYFLFNVLRYFVLYLTLIFNNTLIHNDMIKCLSRAHCSYFDTTPSGNIINRISNDIGILDNTFIFALYFSIQGPILCIVLLVNIFQINYFQIIISVFGFFFVIALFFYCKKAIIQTKQLDLKMKSPVFKGLNQLISGLVQIFILKRRKYYMEQIANRLNDSLKSNLSYWFMSRVFGVYITYILIIVTIGSTFLSISTSNAQNSGLVAVTVVFYLNMVELVQWVARQLINTQSMMVSSQRCLQLTKLSSEKQLITNYDYQINAARKDQQILTKMKLIDWPQHPSISLKNFKFRYQDKLPLVLKGISFEIKAGQKVGIVGRTGAGKSSIIQSLLRLAQPQQDSQYQINGCNAMKMGLHSLRTHISVIPQHPFLFKGTIRKNIDPFDVKKDSEIWQAFQDVKLKQFIQELPQKLQTDLSNALQVFSVGQKQLFCLSRVLLYRTKIIILDEATSNIDYRTDQFIQEIIRNKFKEETVITIAHRLNTLTDYDKIIVMDKGFISEIGSPQQLMEKKGMFYQMVSYTGKGMNSLIKAIFKMTGKN